VFGELEDANETDDAEERERRARLGAGAAHRGEHVEERHVVGHDRHDVDDVLEVAPEAEFRRTRDEAQDHLDGEPRRAGHRQRAFTAAHGRTAPVSKSSSVYRARRSLAPEDDRATVRRCFRDPIFIVVSPCYIAKKSAGKNASETQP